MKIKTAIVALALGAVASAFAAEDYSTWTGHKTLWLNTAASGANVATTQVNFPVAVTLDSTAFGGTYPLGTAADLRFTKFGDLVRLPYQIESYDSVAHKAVVWVLVDTIYGNNGTQKIRAHWGKAGAADSSKSSAVFDSANGYYAVFHMNGTTDETDASQNAYVATASATAPTGGVGAIGAARTFNGTSNYFTVMNSAASTLNLHMTDNYTLSAWVNLTTARTAANTGNIIFAKGNYQYLLSAYDNASPKYWEITTRGNNSYMELTTKTAAISADGTVGAWHHIVGTFQGNVPSGAIAESLYYDGALINTYSSAAAATTGRSETFNLFIGALPGNTAPGTISTNATTARYWTGLLDELRIQNRLRPADWLKMEYANQNPTAQTLVSFTQPPVGISSQHIAPAASTWVSAKPLGNGLVFSAGLGNADKAKLALVDAFGRTVWSGAFAQGMNRLVWDGRSNKGGSVPSGLYFARVTLFDKQGGTLQVLESKVPYTH